MSREVQAKYFDKNWSQVSIKTVPLEFSITSKKILREFVKILKKSKSVADLGCGRGGNVVQFRKVNPNIRYTGIDISPIVIAEARDLFGDSQTRFEAQDLSKDRQINKYDLIYCSQLVEHLEDDESFISRMNKSLTPEGYLLLSTVYKKKNAVYLYKNKRGERALAPDHINEYSEVKLLLDKLIINHFEIIDFDLVMFRFPLIDVILKILMKYAKGKTTSIIVNSPLVMKMRYYLMVPILGFYNFQIIARRSVG
jgi:SAM-dependent methyltransferase